MHWKINSWIVALIMPAASAVAQTQGQSTDLEAFEKLASKYHRFAGPVPSRSLDVIF